MSGKSFKGRSHVRNHHPCRYRFQGAGVLSFTLGQKAYGIDMRIKFNLGTPTYDHSTMVIILNIASRVMGMVIDSVSEVIT